MKDIAEDQRGATSFSKYKNSKGFGNGIRIASGKSSEQSPRPASQNETLTLP